MCSGHMGKCGYGGLPAWGPPLQGGLTKVVSLLPSLKHPPCALNTQPSDHHPAPSRLPVPLLPLFRPLSCPLPEFLRLWRGG